MHTGAAAGLWVMDAYTLAFAVLLCSRPDGSGPRRCAALLPRWITIGPALSGLLLDTLGWRGIFLLNVLSYCSPAGWCAPSGVAGRQYCAPSRRVGQVLGGGVMNPLVRW
ncbi:hypothetical protein E4K10_45950 [Streptomyces sp. T1317-0309]|nr:hypothetical protein E4K10_45950 [Streptomyces sp. T1317-0309]